MVPAATRRTLLVLGAVSLLVASAGDLLPARADGRATARLAGSTAVAPATRGPRPIRSDAWLPNDPLWRASWSLAKVRAPQAWKLTAGAPQTLVAVLDTGVDRGHPDLQGALVDGWDVVGGDADPEDDHGHGTMVAGVIAARANNGIGAVGVCWRCSVMPVKVIDARGIGRAEDIAAGITWAADHGADVINLSFVMSGPDDGVAAAIEHARAAGALVVAAAGNDGGSGPTFPADQPGVVSVTATDAADDPYGWATLGDWVTLAAPGCSQSTERGGGYGEFCGTSSAAALTSGIAALARSAAPALPAGQVAAALRAHAVQVPALSGAGRVDATAALDTVLVSCCGPAAPADSRPGRPGLHPDRL